MTTIAPPESRHRRHHPVMMALLAAAAMACACLYLSDVNLPGQGQAVVKAIPVLCMAVWVFAGSRSRLSSLVAAGLLFSATGDYLLNVGPFIAGMAGFLVAHVLYTAAFITASRRLLPLAALPFVVWGGMAFLLVRPHLGSLTIPVGLYVSVISTMMWRAAAQASEQRGGWIGLAGALLFGISDTMIALGSWSGFGPFPGWLIMAAYWGGQALIAAWGRRLLMLGR